jgi:hypothetical protein
MRRGKRIRSVEERHVRVDGAVHRCGQRARARQESGHVKEATSKRAEKEQKVLGGCDIVGNLGIHMNSERGKSSGADSDGSMYRQMEGKRAAYITVMSEERGLTVTWNMKKGSI